MKRSGQLITLAACAVLLLSACTKISLSGGKSGGGGHGGGSSGGGGGAGGLGAVLDSSRPPAINGDWKISYIYQNEAYESSITFAQQGKALTGKGEDSAGTFFISNGTVDGTKVKFVKKYTDLDTSKPSVTYTGDLEYEDDEDYKGWRMGGHYKAALADGSVIDDKWVGISALAEQAFAQHQQEAQNPPPQQQAPPDQQQNPDQQAEQTQTPAGGEPNLSGMYTAEYTFDFKKIRSKLWLEQDGHNVRGHGVDMNTNEKFVVPKGWYYYPKLTIVCHYEKGKAAAATRDLKVKATVTSGPNLKGETQFGGAWAANIVR